ncbi:MAG: four helix bundle protein [Candidatus Falkowbacteria bacterium]
MSKVYDLENRTATFAKAVKEYVKSLPKIWSDVDYIKQILRSSSSVAANYIEANESLGRKDFF